MRAGGRAGGAARAELIAEHAISRVEIVDGGGGYIVDEPPSITIDPPENRSDRSFEVPNAAPGSVAFESARAGAAMEVSRGGLGRSGNEERATAAAALHRRARCDLPPRDRTSRREMMRGCADGGAGSAASRCSNRLMLRS